MSPRSRGRPTEEREMHLAKGPLLSALRSACAAAQAAVTSDAQSRRIAEDAFLRAAVAFEAFVSDWLPRCVHRDTSQLGATARKTAQDEVQRRYGSGWPRDQDLFSPIREVFETSQPAVSVRVDIPDSLEIATARRVLGVQEATRSLRDTGELKVFAARILARKYRERLSRLSRAEEATLNAAIKIRNVLAHRSTRSVEEMNVALRNGNLPASLRVQQNVTSRTVGRYLRTPRSARPRYEHYFSTLADIANRLAPTRGRPTTICP